ncbi:MAG: hypothetical protein WAM28_04050, partial [Chlamydiales bacterium]
IAHHPLRKSVIIEEPLLISLQSADELFYPFFMETEPQTKEQLYELKAEYAPPFEIALPNEERLTLPSEKPFSFQTDFPTLDPEEETDLTILQGTSLITPSSPVAALEIPQHTEMLYEDETYASFGALASSDSFDIEVEYTPKRSRPGYIFKVTFSPNSNAEFKRIGQNYFFLIDRSNSIPRARYLLNKKAISKALDYLKEGDSFNILIFDARAIRLAEQPLPWNEENISLAREFLDKLPHGGHFAATELYISLGKIIPEDVPDSQLNTAILLSDGDTYLSTERQRLTIGGWTYRNQGKVSLYSVASGTGNNLPLLELLSSFNKGQLIYTSDHEKLNDRLIQLIQSIQNPIGKGMVATAVSSDKQMSILLRPKTSRLPELYQNRPFVIYGSTNRLSDFVLFLQGKYYDKRFDIKKKICFERAKIAPPSLERQWTSLLSQEYYERFFEDGNRAHLEAVKKLLAPFNLPVPLLE